MIPDLTPIIEPGTIRGFRSATQAMALPSGIMQGIQNGRLDDGIVQARDGDTALVNIAGSGSIRGYYTGVFDGVSTAFVALGDSTNVAFYKSTDLTTWSLISNDGVTPATAPYGDTRLTDGDRPVWFSVARERAFRGNSVYGRYSENDLLVIQNGANAPRIYADGGDLSSAFTGYGMSKVTQPDVPVGSKAVVYFRNSFSVSNASTTTITTSGTGIGLADSGASTSTNYLVMSLTVAGWSSPSAKVEFSTPVDFSESKQFVSIIFNPDYLSEPTWYLYLQPTLSDGVETLALGTPLYVDVPGDSEGWKMLVYPIGDNPNIDLTQIESVEWRFLKTPAADQILYIPMMAASGKTLGTAGFALTYYASDTRQEGSPEIILENQAGPLYYSGGPDANFDNILVPEDSRVYYDYLVYAISPSTAQKDAGIDYAVLYRRDAGQTGYYYVGERQMAEWVSPAWDWVGATGGGTPVGFAAGVSANEQDLSKPMPGPGNVCLPTGTAMLTANGRFFVVAEGKTRLYFSDYENPMRFTRAVRFVGENPVLESGGSLAIDGQLIEQLTGMGSFAGGAETSGAVVSGAATIFIFTNQNLYSLSGYDSASLSRYQMRLAHGTLSPFSVARYKNGFCWLDDEGQAQFYGQGGHEYLSRLKVDDITMSIPATRRQWVSGAFRSGRYHLSYTPSGGSTNTRALVYSFFTGEWESVDTLSVDTPFFMPFYSENRLKIMALSGRAIYEYAKPSEGTVSFSVTTSEKSLGWIKRIAASAMAILADSVSGGSVTTKRFFPGETATPASGTINLYAPGTLPRSWKMDQAGVGGQGGSVYFSVEYAAAPAGWRLFCMAVEMKEVTGGGPARD